jgi:glycosyltransferase involved in cell wall biosynthesis
MSTIADVSRPEWDVPRSGLDPPPAVSIIVPACNEEVDIAQSIAQLLALDYDRYEVIAVDDRSIDRTGEILDGLAASPQAQGVLQVIHIPTLPPGWLGKPHAMWTAGERARGDWLLFTDADVRFRPDSLRRVMAYARAEAAAHVVLFPEMVMRRPGETMMIAFFQTLFVFGHRPWKVADPKARDHIGVGAFNLIRRDVYETLGTYRALRFDVLDDMKLGKLVKTGGYPQRNVFGRDLISIRWAESAMGVVDNLTKNLFAVLSFQSSRVIASACALVFLNVAPFVGAFVAPGWSRLPYALALASMFAMYVGMARRSRIPAYYFLLHPASALLFVYAMLRSMRRALRERGVVWRGTKYSLEELRQGQV